MYGSLVTRVTTICVGVDRGSYVTHVGTQTPQRTRTLPRKVFSRCRGGVPDLVAPIVFSGGCATGAAAFMPALLHIWLLDAFPFLGMVGHRPLRRSGPLRPQKGVLDGCEQPGRSGPEDRRHSGRPGRHRGHYCGGKGLGDAVFGTFG